MLAKLGSQVQRPFILARRTAPQFSSFKTNLHRVFPLLFSYLLLPPSCRCSVESFCLMEIVKNL
jgi:hypothetical protein